MSENTPAQAFPFPGPEGSEEAVFVQCLTCGAVLTSEGTQGEIVIDPVAGS